MLERVDRIQMAVTDAAETARAFQDLLGGITVNVTEMFRDPAFFQGLREQVVPHLRTWPHL